MPQSTEVVSALQTARGYDDSRIYDATTKVLETLDADLISVGFEPSEDLDDAIEELTDLIQEVNEEIEDAEENEEDDDDDDDDDFVDDDDDDEDEQTEVEKEAGRTNFDEPR